MSWSTSSRLLLAGLLLLAPAAAHACPGCVAPEDSPTTAGYLMATALMALLPLLMIGGGAVWIARSLKRPADPAGREQ